MKIRTWLLFIITIFIVCISDLSFADAIDFVQHAESDIDSSFVQWPAVILVGGGIASALLFRFDDNIEAHFLAHQTSKKFDDAVDIAANPYLLSGVTAITYGISLLSQNQKFKLETETMAEALVFTGVMNAALKYTVRRTRPDGGSLSFPSAHTSASFAIASVFQSMNGWKVGVPAYALAGMVAFTRLDGNHHHLTDVVFGAALGSSIGWGTALFHKKENTRLLISPILDQTRGLMLTYKF